MFFYHFLEKIDIPNALQLSYLFANDVIWESNDGEVFGLINLFFCFFRTVRRRKFVIVNAALNSLMVMIC